jgi:hypothetical protein
MFAQALANRLARGGVHLAPAPPMIWLLLVTRPVVLFLVGKPEDIGFAGLACLIPAIAAWLIGRTQGARGLPAEAQA